VAGSSFRDCVILKCVREDRAAFIEFPESARELLPEARQIVRAHSIDRDEHDQLWLRCASRLSARWMSNEREQNYRQQSAFESTHHLND
jgi:hypothetical protein